MQRQVFPSGRPADTAGFSVEPAATQSSVVTLDQRLDAVERQMTELLRQSEENGNRLAALQAGIAKVRSDQEQRIGALEQRIAEAATAAPVAAPPPSTARQQPSLRVQAHRRSPARRRALRRPTCRRLRRHDCRDASDPGEDAYSEGFHEWQSGQYDQAIATLKAFTAAYPKHRRVSYANNLIGRALLDKGDPRAAAEAFSPITATTPMARRAQDSLYYLGQSLMKLGQPGQACKAYAELTSVYGSKVRPELQKPIADAKAQAQCS